MKSQINTTKPHGSKEWVCNTFDKFLLWASLILSAIIAFSSLFGSASLGVAIAYIALTVVAAVGLNEANKNNYIIRELVGKVAYVYAWFICGTFTLGFVAGFIFVLSEV